MYIFVVIIWRYKFSDIMAVAYPGLDQEVTDWYPNPHACMVSCPNLCRPAQTLDISSNQGYYGGLNIFICAPCNRTMTH